MSQSNVKILLTVFSDYIMSTAEMCCGNSEMFIRKGQNCIYLVSGNCIMIMYLHIQYNLCTSFWLGTPFLMSDNHYIPQILPIVSFSLSKNQIPFERSKISRRRGNWRQWKCCSSNKEISGMFTSIERTLDKVCGIGSELVRLRLNGEMIRVFFL